MTDCPNCEYHKNRAARWGAEAYKHAGYNIIELPWVGLTDAEITACIQMGESGYLDGFVKPLATFRAIEVKLKEKNT